MDYFDRETLLTMASMLAAGISFVAVVLPLVQREEKRAHYQDMIARKRRDIYEQSLADLARRPQGAKVKATDAKKSIETMFKVRKTVGSLADDMRMQMMQAGYRNPNAPLIFFFMRFALPLVFIVLSMMVMGAMKKEVADAMKFLVIASVAVFGFVLPRILLKNTIIKRQTEINTRFPDALDMMLVCVQGGLSIEAAINRIAEEVSEHSALLAQELGILGAELGLLSNRRQAFQDFAKRVGSGAAKSFATAMIQAEQYGTGISSAIRTMADESRDIRMAEAERKAAALPPKLTVPMILFFLPALFVVILGPAGIRAVAASHGG